MSKQEILEFLRGLLEGCYFVSDMGDDAAVDYSKLMVKIEEGCGIKQSKSKENKWDGPILETRNWGSHRRKA